MPAHSHAIPLFVVSAPSGTGKTSLNRALMRLNPGFVKAITHTTRAPRGTEQNAVDYYFVSPEQFKNLVKNDEMLEYASVFGNLYGTSRTEVKRLQDLGKTVILELDVQGWQSVQKLQPSAKGIFIFPPSLIDLWERLEKRGTDDLKTRLKRILTAKEEILASNLFHFFVINDDFEAACSDLNHVIVDDAASRLDFQQGLEHRLQLLSQFDEALWLKAHLMNYPEISSS